MPRLASLASLTTAMVLAAGGARADDVSDIDVTVTHSTTAESHIDNANGNVDDDNYGILINRINLNGHAGDLSAHLRLDTTTFYERPEPSGLPYKNDLRLERFKAEYQLGDWRLVGGDFYRQLGRGILLSLRKEDEVGVDNTIRGGEIRYSGDAHEASLFAGAVNPVNLDTVSQKFVKDTNDVMVGGEYHFRGWDGVDLGAHALFLYPRVSLLESDQDWSQSFGAFFELSEITDWLSVYGEADGQVRMLAGTEQFGIAAYGTADLHFGDTTFLLEGIYISGFEQLGSTNTAVGNRTAYNRVPTLQRIQEEVLNSRDAVGGRLKVEQYIESIDLVLIGNALVRFAGEDQEVRQLHGWGGGELGLWNGASPLKLTVGYRNETQNDAFLKSMVHFSVDWSFPIGGGFALHPASDTEYRELGERDYWRGSTYLGLEKSGVGNVTFELGYDTLAEGTVDEEEIRTIFFAGIVGLEVSSALKLNVVGGTQRGGLKCVSGVCREYPAFAGARVEVVGRW